jgi:hypothetical protein
LFEHPAQLVSQWWLALLVLMLVPLVQVATLPSWSFSCDGYIDPWMNLGYFLHLKEFIVAFDGIYQTTRLAWILPGYVAHSLFSPLMANAVLRLYICWMAVISVFLSVRRTYGVRCALICGLLLYSYPDFLFEAGWDYVYGAAIAYTLLSIEELTAAAAALTSPKGSARLRAAFAGMAFAGAVHSQIFVLIFVPVLVLLTAARTGKKGLSLALPVGIGFIFITVCLGAINVSLGGHFLFFLPSFSTAVRLGTGPNPWYIDPSKWVNAAWWLVIPTSVCISSLAFLFRSTWKARGWSAIVNSDMDRRVRMADAASIVLAMSIYIVLQIKGSPVLQLPYYSALLTSFLPAAAAALIGRRLAVLERPHFVILAASCGLLALLVGTDASRYLPAVVLAAFNEVRGLIGVSAPLLIVILAAAFVLADYVKQRVAAQVIVAAAVTLVTLHLGSLQLEEWVGSTKMRQQYLDVVRVSRELGQAVHGKPLWFWFGSNGAGYGHDLHYTAISSTYLYMWRLLGDNMPDATNAQHIDGLKAGSYLAILDRRQELRDEAVDNLKKIGVSITPVKSLTWQAGVNEYGMLLGQVSGIEEPMKVSTASQGREGLAPAGELRYDTQKLATTVERNFYKPGGGVAEGAPAGVFRSTDGRDHVATPFAALGTIATGNITAIEVDVNADKAKDSYGPVNMLVQDQGYNTLFSSGTLTAGDRDAVLTLPPGTRTIRLAFLPNDEGFIRLPETVRLEAYRPK